MHVASMGNEGNTGLGVMGQPNGAVRDPLFFRWHKVIILYNFQRALRSHKSHLPF